MTAELCVSASKHDYPQTHSAVQRFDREFIQLLPWAFLRD